MTEATKCNYCVLVGLRLDAAREGNVVTVRPAKGALYAGCTSIYVHPEGQEPTEKQSMGWFAGPATVCECTAVTQVPGGLVAPGKRAVTAQAFSGLLRVSTNHVLEHDKLDAATEIITVSISPIFMFQTALLRGAECTFWFTSNTETEARAAHAVALELARSSSDLGA